MPIPVPLRARRLARGAEEVHLAPQLAVPLVYLGALAVLSVLVVSLVPAMGPQLIKLSQTMPDAMKSLAGSIQGGEDTLRRLGFRGDISSVLQPTALAQQIGSAGSAVVQQSLGLASSIASLLFSAFVVLILSFYMTLDGPRIGEQIIEGLPPALRDEARHFLELVDRVFGGFLRTQLLQSLIYGCATAVVMAALGIGDVALGTVLSALLIAIPLVGSFFALIPPVLLALSEAPQQTLVLVVLLFVVQQVLFNLIMPRLMGRSVGLHPLLVFAAMLIGGTVAGGWGLLFGIPVAGVVASLLQFLYQRAARRAFNA
jgi:predicted PurR-regulated permease PerM